MNGLNSAAVVRSASALAGVLDPGVDWGGLELPVRVSAPLAEVEKLLAGEFAGLDTALRQPASVTVLGDGVRLRPLFTVLAGQVGPRPDDSALVTAAAVLELVHLATLCHGRVHNGAPARRPVSDVSVPHGPDLDILTGDYLSAHASVLVSTLGADAARIVAETFATVVTGQMREKSEPPPNDDPVDRYLRIAQEKTGTLISACCRFGGMYCGASVGEVEVLARIGATAGIVAHIADDLTSTVAASDNHAIEGGFEAAVREQLLHHAVLADAELAVLPPGAGAGADGLRGLVRRLVERAG